MFNVNSNNNSINTTNTETRDRRESQLPVSGPVRLICEHSRVVLRYTWVLCFESTRLTE